MPPTESGAATVGMSSPARRGDGGHSSLGRAVGRGGPTLRQDRAGRLHVLVDPREHVAERAAQAVALVLHVPRDGLDVAGELRPDGLEPRDLLAQVALGVLGDRLGPLLGLAQHAAGRAPRRRPRTARACASASAWVWSTNFWASSSVRCKVSSLTAGAAAAVRLLSCALLQHALELGDALGRLPESLPRLAHLFLQRLGVHRDTLEVLVDVVDVIAAKSLAEFDGAQAVEARALAVRLSTVHGGNPSHGGQGHAPAAPGPWALPDTTRIAGADTAARRRARTSDARR